MRIAQEITAYSGVTPVAITSSTDAEPVIVTATAHGFSTGDRVLIYGHTTNIAANGIFKVTKTSANAFSLQDEYTGADIAGTGAGAGADGLCVSAPPVLLVSDFKHAIISVITAGTATLTCKVAGSLGRTRANETAGRKDLPNFGSTVSATSPYTFVQIIDMDTSSAINGATGIVVAGTDIAKTYEVNINALKWLTVFPISWTQGSITMKIQVLTDD